MFKQFIAATLSTLIATSALTSSVNASQVSALNFPAGWETKAPVEEGISTFDGNEKTLTTDKKASGKKQTKKK